MEIARIGGGHCAYAGTVQPVYPCGGNDRFALYGQFNLLSFLAVLGALILFFLLAVWGYDPQHGMVKKTRQFQRPRTPAAIGVCVRHVAHRV
jgi:hypothetical protein